MKSKEQMIEWLIAHREIAIDKKEAVERKLSYLMDLGIANDVCIVETDLYKDYEAELNSLVSEICAIDNHLNDIESGILVF